jgi:hypothetical protein
VGLLDVPLVHFTLSLFAGRLVSYSLYVGGASLAKHRLEHTLTGAFSSWWGITLQVLMLAGLVALVKVDWTRVLSRRAAGMQPHG